MLIMCEETEVVRYVEEFLLDIGLKDEEFMGVHSKKMEKYLKRSMKD